MHCRYFWDIADFSGRDLKFLEVFINYLIDPNSGGCKSSADDTYYASNQDLRNNGQN